MSCRTSFPIVSSIGKKNVAVIYVDILPFLQVLPRIVGPVWQMHLPTRRWLVLVRWQQMVAARLADKMWRLPGTRQSRRFVRSGAAPAGDGAVAEAKPRQGWSLRGDGGTAGVGSLSQGLSRTPGGICHCGSSGGGLDCSRRNGTW